MLPNQPPSPSATAGADRVVTVLIGLVAGTVLLAAPTPSVAATPGAVSRSALASKLGELIQESPENPEGKVDVAVAYRTLDGERELLLGADEPYHAASTMKVPVLIELFRRHQNREIDLDDRIRVRNRFHSIVDGSVYRLSPEDDSDPKPYLFVGKRLSYRQLAEAMIARSSNLATNLLIERLGAKNIQVTTDRLGAPGMKVLRGVEDIKAFRAGLSNETTARALLVLMEAIAKGSAVSTRSSQEMIEILARQEFNEGIPSGLPSGVRVAHKTGNITRIHHDAAIVFSQRPYVLVVLVRGIDEIAASARLIAAVSREVYEFNESPD